MSAGSGIDRPGGREVEQERLVADQIVENGRQKSGHRCGGPEALRLQPGLGEEPAEALRLFREVREGCNCEYFRLFGGGLAGGGSH
jgi:hypothetical protein